MRSRTNQAPLKHNLWREECTVLFVGYQAEGTLGRKIIEGANKVNLFGEEVQINANIEKMQGISGHADKNMLLSWLASIPQKPKVVFVNHGHDTVCDEFAKSIENELEISALAPYSGDGFELGDVVRQVDIGPRKLYDKKLHKLSAIIRFMTGFTLQVKILCLLLKLRGDVLTRNWAS